MEALMDKRARDRAKDDKSFHWFSALERKYVYNLYPGYEDKVKVFLRLKSADGTINHFTYMMVYQLIEKELNLEIPE